MENKNHLKIVHNSNDELVEKMHNDLKERPLNTQELLAKLDTLGSIQDKERFVIENLRRKGFDV